MTKFKFSTKKTSSKKSQKSSHKNKKNVDKDDYEVVSSPVKTPKPTNFARGFSSQSLKSKFSRSLAKCLSFDLEAKKDERFQLVDEDLRRHISPNLVLLAKARKANLKWIEDALTEIDVAKKKSQRTRETTILQQLNFMEVSHLTFEKEAKLLKTAQAGIVKLLNAVAAAKKNKVNQQKEAKEKTDAKIDGDQAYELLKKDKFNYRFPDRVTIHNKDL